MPQWDSPTFTASPIEGIKIARDVLTLDGGDLCFYAEQVEEA